MTGPIVVTCGLQGTARTMSPQREVSLDLYGPDANVNLRIASLTRKMEANATEVVVDLIEIAAYVFAADQAVSRGSPTDTGEKWRREFEFRIPVRRPAFWRRREVVDALTDLLAFLTDDEFTFSFSQISNAPAMQLYLEAQEADQAPEIERVLLFSGGADSLAGAVQTTLVERKSAVLVSHRSSPKRKQDVDDLVAELASRAAPRPVRHVAVWATKSESVGREYTQRSRSFLFNALGTAVASMLGLDRISFYENGVTSINLPLAGQLVGSRATRTTHPRAIEGFSRLSSLVLDKPFVVESPFLWSTKVDVMRMVRDAGVGSLLAKTVSCSRTVEAARVETHCGRCSQCLDRRFAALAAGLTDDEDPARRYKVDLLLGERAFGEDRTMGESFVGRAQLMSELNDVEFFAHFPEAGRVLRHTGLDSDEAAKRTLEVHRRHGGEVGKVLVAGIKNHADALKAGTLPDSCLLVLCLSRRYRGSDDHAAGPEPRLVHEGAVWKARFENEDASFKDSKGLRYVAVLLQNPGRDFHCVELMRAEAGDTGPIDLASRPEVADPKALQECRKRLKTIKAEIEQAEGAGDTAQVLALREEKERIEVHVRSATGKGARARRFTDENERARKAVGTAIGRALAHIGRAKHLPLWRHLKAFLFLGTTCAYRPTSPVRWTIKT